MDNLSRRDFGKLVGTTTLALSIGGSTLFVEGCSVMSSIEDWVPVGISAVKSIETILGANGFPLGAAAQALLDAVLGGLAQLLADVKIYQAITPPPVGALAKVQAAFGVITQNFQAFLSSVNIGNSPLLQTIVAIAQVVLSTIAGFVGKLPVTPATRMQLSHMTITMSGGTYPVNPVVRTRGNFKRNFNSDLDEGRKNGLTIPPEAYMKLTVAEHLHFPNA